MLRAAILPLLLFAACRSTPPLQVRAGGLLRGDPGSTFAQLEALGKKGIAPEDEALWRCELGTAALCMGDEASAFRAFDGAARVMGTLESSSTENARAIFGQEATKTWKGDPYERCMNALYKGLLYWRRGDLDNASACFKRGLLADAWSAEGESQVDFAALSFLLGWVSDRRGKEEQARFSLKEAGDHSPPLAGIDPRAHRALVVCDLGLGPRKYATGTGDALVKFEQGAYAECGIEIAVDGVTCGRSLPATDLFHQAVTRGDKVIDGIRKGKAVFKAGTAIAGAILLSEGSRRHDEGQIAAGIGLLLLSALTRSEADIRCWTLLPGQIQFLPLDLAPGRHRLTVRALDRGGLPLAGWERVFDVEVPTSGDSLYYVRACGEGVIYGLFDPPVRAVTN